MLQIKILLLLCGMIYGKNLIWIRPDNGTNAASARPRSNEICPYNPGDDSCIRKHLLAGEAYADETEPVEKDKNWKEQLETIETKARDYRIGEEAFITGTQEKLDILIEDQARSWCKKIEPQSLSAMQKTESK